MKLGGKTVQVLWSAFILLVAIILLQNLIIFLSVEGAPVQGNAASGDVNICINHPPHWLNPPECGPAYTGLPFSCDVPAIDRNGHNITDYMATITSGPVSDPQVLTNISDNGTIVFIAKVFHLGNYTIQLSATDNASCPMTGIDDLSLTVLPYNNSPYLVRPIPNSTWNQGSLLIPYNLNTYFDDPDGDALTFRANGNTQIKITISSSGEVTLTPAEGYCGTEIVTYTASDPTNLTATSNDVHLTVTCVASGDEGSAPSGGGGGGGGGAVLSSSSCEEIYYCYEWSECQYTKAVTETGDPLTINITGVLGSKIYSIEDMPEDTTIFYEGFQWRECVDTNQCDVRSIYKVRDCSYQPNCYDHIQNQDETAVDCGGSVCAPCGTCSDGIQNGLEEGLDCGGPECQPCYSCSDGIMNGNELGVDCGGTDCVACASCFDGIQNQGETGVDCGGPCSVCREIQEPGIIPKTSRGTVLLLSLVVVMAAIVAGLLIFKALMKSWLARLALRYQKRNRIILLSHEQRDALLSVIERVERQLGSEAALKRQSLVGDLVRRYLSAAVGAEHEIAPERLPALLGEQHIHPELQPVMSALLARSTRIEFTERAVPVALLHMVIEELRLLVHETSVFTPADLQQLRENMPETPHLPEELASAERVTLLVKAAYQQLIAGQLLGAQQLYREANTAYAQVPEELQRALYDDIARLYSFIRFVVERQKSLWARNS